MSESRSLAVPFFTRRHSIVVSRVIICAVVTLAVGSYFLQPVGALQWILDLCGRAYLHFIGGSMAHEGSHGHLGNSRASNSFWGRLALVPSTVPWVTFRSTHLHHHANTNVPDQDPDAFLDTPHKWQIPFRAIAMPHQWVVWMRRNGKFGRRELVDYSISYAILFAIYGAIGYFVGAERVLIGLFGSAFLHSFLLWYPFAIKTHEGYSTGPAEERSFNYYGRATFWASAGLSMHKIHHLKPRLSWLEMFRYVEPGTLRQRLTFQTDRTATLAAATARKQA